jgi:hypothetical protein
MLIITITIRDRQKSVYLMMLSVAKFVSRQ